ncbi:YfhO family protein, partial [Spirochaetota bacterium]
MQKIEEQPGRIKLTTRGPYLNYFLTYLIPLYGLQSVDIPAARSMSSDYATFFSKMNGNSLRYYELLNVRFFLSNNPLGIPGLAPRFNFQHPGTKENIYCYEYTNTMPRAQIVYSHVASAELDDIFNTLQSPGFDPRKSVLLISDDDHADKFPPAHNTAHLQYSTDITEYKQTKITIRTTLQDKGMLVLADHFDIGWNVYIDNKKSSIVRANYLMRGVFLDSGEHTVIFKYEPSMATYTISLIGLFILLILICIYFYRLYEQMDGASAAGN